jgi:predicted kinase
MLVIIRGLPGSGKSTLAKLFQRDGYTHIENDQFRARSGEYVYDPEENRAVKAWCFRTVRAALRQGRNVVVSNTFCELECVKEYTDLALRYGHEYTVIEAKGSFGSVMGCDAAGMEQRRAKWEHYPV